jgi:hypothetical protein
VLRNFLVFVVVSVAVATATERAMAQVTTESGASILVFPKVVADGSADTILQLVNLSDNRIDALCAYVDGRSASWQAAEFPLALGPRRPLHWTAARGSMTGTGEDAVDIPAAPTAFRGELLCVQVDGTGAPFSGNELGGQATLADLATGDVSAYRAAGLRGSGLNDGDGFLCIGGEPSDNCLIGAEYDSCPGEWIVNFPAEGAGESQIAPGTRIASRLTVVPCSQNLRDNEASTVEIEVTVFNELAQRFSSTASATCWADLSLADIANQIFTRAMLGTDFGEARLSASDGAGFMLLAETTTSTGDALVVEGSAAGNPHHRGNSAASDLIVLP